MLIYISMKIMGWHAGQGENTSGGLGIQYFPDYMDIKLFKGMNDLAGLSKIQVTVVMTQQGNHFHAG